MEEVTLHELQRNVRRLEDRLPGFVPRELYDRDLHEVRADIREIKEGQRRLIWMVVGVLTTVVAQIIVGLVTTQI